MIRRVLMLVLFPFVVGLAQEPPTGNPVVEPKLVPWTLANRVGAKREAALKEYGGNAASEAAVARGLQWLALHQANDGSWSLVDYNKTTREKPLGQGGKVTEVTDGDKTQGATENKVAATAFALLALLGSGHTHKFDKNQTVDTSKTVTAGLDWLMRNQGKDGSFGNEMYGRAVATQALAEAYAMTSDPRLKVSLTSAVRYFIQAQHDGGGWRYQPKMAGDLSITSRVMTALHTAELAGIAIPKETWLRADKFLDSVQDPANQGFRYTPDREAPTPTMTAAGVLSRLRRGMNTRNPVILTSMDFLSKRSPAEAPRSLYFADYATQAHFCIGADSWETWNLGPERTGMNGMRDLLIKGQDTGEKKAFQTGSWAPTVNFHDGNSRLLSTALAILNLEVYYRVGRANPIVPEATPKEKP